ncbi:hypothetical protein G6F59_015544 [Rhizopus arrhizus]|nr:hypothetical protein G6F59_015544 [Rhizopus arrhizus]
MGRAFRAQEQRAVPGPRPALPDRAGRLAQAQGNLLHPRRSLSGGRAEARPAGAGGRGHAGGGDRPQRQPAGKGEVEHAGSARPGWRAVRVRRPGQQFQRVRRRAREPHAAPRRRAQPDRAHHSGAAAGVPHRTGAWHRRGQAAQPGQERDGGVMVPGPAGGVCRHAGPEFRL